MGIDGGGGGVKGIDGGGGREVGREGFLGTHAIYLFINLEVLGVPLHGEILLNP